MPIVTGFRMAVGRHRVASGNSAGDGDAVLACLARLLGGARGREAVLSCHRCAVYVADQAQGECGAYDDCEQSTVYGCLLEVRFCKQNGRRCFGFLFGTENYGRQPSNMI
jgi:hypothetical protein